MSIDNSAAYTGRDLIDVINSGRYEDALFLIERGCDVEAFSEICQSALSAACSHGRLDIVMAISKKIQKDVANYFQLSELSSMAYSEDVTLIACRDFLVKKGLKLDRVINDR